MEAIMTLGLSAVTKWKGLRSELAQVAMTLDYATSHELFNVSSD